MSVLSEKLETVWAYLNTPSAFLNNWYGELCDQIGHTAAATAAVAIVTSVSLLIWQDLPYKFVLASLVVVPYVFGIEWGEQGWYGWDSAFDSLMWTIGAIWPAATFSYVGIGPEGAALLGHDLAGQVLMTFHPWGFLGCLALWFIVMIPRLWVRIKTT